MRLVAVHTSHWDPVYERVVDFLARRHPGVRFMHWSPSSIFGGEEGDVAGRMITPPQLRRVQAGALWGSEMREAPLTRPRRPPCA